MLLNNIIDIEFQRMPEVETPPTSRLEFGRLISAAVVNRSFRQRLIDNPLEAIESGYNGETFFFSLEEKRMLESIEAVDLQDFAATLIKLQAPISVTENELEPSSGYSIVKFA